MKTRTEGRDVNRSFAIDDGNDVGVVFVVVFVVVIVVVDVVVVVVVDDVVDVVVVVGDFQFFQYNIA